MNRFSIAAFMFACCLSHQLLAREPIIGLPCEGCETVFEGMPKDIRARARIAPVEEPGEPMTITGKVFGADDAPRADVIVYAYHTDARGIYPHMNARDTTRHGTLRGWARTDANGNFTFDTIRPASYPNTNIPQHIHVHVIEPDCATYYIEDIQFTDDPKLAAAHVPDAAVARGGNGVVTPRKESGSWQVRRDIRLGANIRGHNGCPAKNQSR